MTSQVPVGASISRAYGFAFGNIVNNFGAILVPTLLLYALTYYYERSFPNAAMDMADPEMAMRALPRFLGYTAAALALLIAAYAALTAESLGLRKGNAFLQFPFGAGMWRTFGAYLLFYLVLIIIIVAFRLGNGLILRIVGGPPATAALLKLCLNFVTLCFVIYVSVRMGFLLAPVAVAERRVSLIQAWQLTQRNFWRSFAVLLVICAPLVAIWGIYLKEVGFFEGFSLNMTPEQMEVWRLHQFEVSRHMNELSKQYWYISYPISFVLSAIIYGLFAGASACAYRAVAESDGTTQAEAF